MAKQSILTIENYNAVLAAFKEAKGVVADDHNGGMRTIKAAGIAALVKGDKVTPVLLADSRYFSVNHVYLLRGEVRVSRTSVGGVVFPQDHDMDVVKAVEAYNAQQVDNPFTCGQLMHVRMVKFDDAGNPAFGEPVDLAGEVIQALVTKEPIAQVNL